MLNQKRTGLSSWQDCSREKKEQQCFSRTDFFFPAFFLNLSFDETQIKQKRKVPIIYIMFISSFWHKTRQETYSLAFLRNLRKLVEKSNCNFGIHEKLSFSLI